MLIVILDSQVTHGCACRRNAGPLDLQAHASLCTTSQRAMTACAANDAYRHVLPSNRAGPALTTHRIAPSLNTSTMSNIFCSEPSRTFFAKNKAASTVPSA